MRKPCGIEPRLGDATGEDRGVQPPWSGSAANAALFTASHASSSLAGHEGAHADAVAATCGVPARGSGTRICQSSRSAASPAAGASASVSTSAPKVQRRHRVGVDAACVAIAASSSRSGDVAVAVFGAARRARSRARGRRRAAPSRGGSRRCRRPRLRRSRATVPGGASRSRQTASPNAGCSSRRSAIVARSRAISRARRACAAGQRPAPRPSGPRVASARGRARRRRLGSREARRAREHRGGAARGGVPGHRDRALRAAARQPVPAADRDDPLGAVHRRDGQQGHARGVRALPDAGRPRGGQPARARGAHPLHRLLPLEGEEPHRHGRRARRALRRRGARPRSRTS